MHTRTFGYDARKDPVQVGCLSDVRPSSRIALEATYGQKARNRGEKTRPSTPTSQQIASDLALPLLTALRRTRPTQIPNRQSKVTGILSEHTRQCDIVGDKGGDDPERSSCGVDGGATGEFGDEEEEEGYVQEEEEGGEGD